MVEEYENVDDFRRRAGGDAPEACYKQAEAYHYGKCGLRPDAAKAFLAEIEEELGQNGMRGCIVIGARDFSPETEQPETD